MGISVVRDDSIKIIEIDGRIDVKTSEEVMEKVIALLDGKPTIISMEKVPYVSSSGLRALLMIAKKARTQHITTVYAALIPEVKDVMKMTGFLKMLQCADTVPEAEKILSQG